MIVFRDPAEVPADFGPSVVAIGKFDGVHAGHRAVIDRARIDASDGARVVAVMVWRMHVIWTVQLA